MSTQGICLPINQNFHWTHCYVLSNTGLFLPHSGVPCSDAATGTAAETLVTTGDGLLQCSGWKTPSSSACAAMMPWSSTEYRQQESCAQSLAYPASTLTTDLYMQTLCPSYTMLTYTHTPLLTNFGVSNVFQTSAISTKALNWHFCQIR